MGSSRFLLQAHVDAVYEAAPRRLAFKARTPDEFGAWQAALRQKTLALLGLAERTPPESVAAEKLQAVERDGYVEEKYLLDAGEGVSIPTYLLIPRTEPPYRPVLVFHGHNPSVQWILGNYPSAEEREIRLKADNNYAQALAQAGYLVCAVEQRGFGERQTENGRGSVHENSCRHLAFTYQMTGRNLVGERCWDGMCAIAFLQGRPGCGAGCSGLHRQFRRGHDRAVAVGDRRADHRLGAGLLSLLVPRIDLQPAPLRMQLRTRNPGMGGDGRFGGSDRAASAAGDRGGAG